MLSQVLLTFVPWALCPMWKSLLPSAAQEGYIPNMSTQRDNIRNFSIIAHIDHGKSTLADRLIQHCGGLTDREMSDQALKKNEALRSRPKLCGSIIKPRTAKTMCLT